MFDHHHETDGVAESSATAHSGTQTPSDQSEQAIEGGLIQGLRVGETAARKRVIHLYGARVMRTARRYLRQEADIADCFQSTFLQVFDKIGSFEQRSSLWAWIRRIAINECLMQLRRTQRHPQESIDELLPAFDETGRRVEPTSRVTGLENALQGEDIRHQVREAINQLPDQYRTVVLLRDIDGYSTEETALVLGIRRNAVKTRLHRARSALKALLEPLVASLGAPR